MAVPVSTAQRFTPRNPCPVCGGHDRLPRGDGRRCWGFLGSDGTYAHCSREEYAGELPLEPESVTYAHRLHGPCRCGVTHGDGSPGLSIVRSNGAGRRIVAAYDYSDEAGALLYQAVRFEPKDFHQRRPDGRGGWVWSLSDVRRVLYRLPELLAADSAEWVIYCEGEKDADALAALGFVATTNAMGAGKWRPEYAVPLRGRRVCLPLDNDKDGEKHGRVVGGGLHGTAAEVRVLRLPGLPDAGDVSDWLAAGGTAEEMARLIEGAPAWEPATPASAHPLTGYRVRASGNTFDCIAPLAIDWLWAGVVARGFISEVSGDPGQGKSLLTAEIAARVSTGRPLPGGSARVPAGVVMVSYEDDPAAVIRPRLEAAGADLPRVFCLRGVRDDEGQGEERDAVLPADLDALRDAIARVDAVLVVIDPLLTALDRRFDSHKDADTKQALRPLTALAQMERVALLFVRHPNKSGGRAVTRPGGSIGITGTARLSSLIATDPDDPERRLLLPVKSNLGALHPAWPFRIVGDGPGSAPRVVLDKQPLSLTADDVLGVELAHPEERAALGEVVAWLDDTVSLGPKPVKELQAEAGKAGFGWRTVEKAKARLGLKASKSGFGHAGAWTWGNPDHELAE